MRVLATLFLSLNVLCLSGCQDRAGEEEPGAESPVTSGESSDTMAQTAEPDELMIVERLPLGLSYDEVAARFPGVSPLRSEGTAPSLREATLDRRVFDRRAVLELNFDADRLYSYYFRLDSLVCDSARVLYDRLQEFYDGQFGVGREETQQEGAYEATSRYWRADTLGVSATLGQQSGFCRLSWGFQEQMP